MAEIWSGGLFAPGVFWATGRAAKGARARVGIGWWGGGAGFARRGHSVPPLPSNHLCPSLSKARDKTTTQQPQRQAPTLDSPEVGISSETITASPNMTEEKTGLSVTPDTPPVTRELAMMEPQLSVVSTDSASKKAV